MIDLVQVPVDGLAVRVRSDHLGVKVELERGGQSLLFEVDSEGLTVVGAELREEGGAMERIISSTRSAKAQSNMPVNGLDRGLTRQSCCWPTR